MTTQRAKLAYAQALSPFPEGWYFVTSREEILRSRIIQKTWMGEDIVVWCDEDGQVCVADAYCPHLGSQLGPAAGGRVCAGRLVCPFHGFEFDASGQCVATPFADPPKTARLKVFETQDINGLIFAWWGMEGRKPQWRLPAELPDQTGWCSYNFRTVRFPGHPQETSENSVDLAHLRYVHGYDNVKRIGKATVTGPYMDSRFDFTRTLTVARIPISTLNISTHTLVCGMGYSYVQIHERSIGMDLRLWVLATPVDGTLIDMTLVSQAKEIRNPKRIIAGLGFLPVGIRAPLINRFLSAVQLRDVLQDVIIWSRKRYVSRPRLSRSDGEIMPFRAYCAQFYPNRTKAARPQPVAHGSVVR